MKGAALARAARGWHADARDRALGADLKNEDIVYMFCELFTLHLLGARVQYHKTSTTFTSSRPARSRLQLSNWTSRRVSFVLCSKHLSLLLKIGAVSCQSLKGMVFVLDIRLHTGHIGYDVRKDISITESQQAALFRTSIKVGPGTSW
jgi:hypothetical protein